MPKFSYHPKILADPKPLDLQEIKYVGANLEILIPHHLAKGSKEIIQVYHE